MSAFCNLTKVQLQEAYSNVKKDYEDYVNLNLSLDMSRGKPGVDQLALSGGMMNSIDENDYMSESGIDCRNYGCLDGIPEMKRIFAEIMDLEPDEVVVGSNSSLSMMFDNVAVNMSHGVRGGEPWHTQGKVKFLCPSPGYDRHFAISEYFHIKMIPVDMTPTGPDMDTVEALARKDPMIKGMWCVPIFSNPDGCVYSEETVRRIANLNPAADDFRLYWDNAYCIHNFRGERPVIPNILRECEKAGNPNMPLIFTSFSKISFSGAAVSAMASSRSSCEYIKERLGIQTIGPDKLNQLRHVRFFKNAHGVYTHMEKLAELIRPKFKVVLSVLNEKLYDKEIATWNDPDGGYFISFNTKFNCAKRVVTLCKEAGVTMTTAGATYPYGKDPLDQNIRIAPTYPSLDELKIAMEVFCTCVQLATLEKLIEK